MTNNQMLTTTLTVEARVPVIELKAELAAMVARLDGAVDTDDVALACSSLRKALGRASYRLTQLEELANR